MKRLGSVAIVSLLAFVGCDHASRLDKTTKAMPKTEAAEASSASPTPSAKADHAGTVEDRLARLEDSNAKNAEALEFLNKVYAQQKQQQQAQEREEAAPDAMFAVDVASDVKAGQVEGSPQALVTIVEAWDFA